MNQPLAQPCISNQAAGADEPVWVDAVLAFWFGVLSPGQWFAKDAALDADIRTRFLDTHATVLAHTPAANSARIALASVIVLDQFSRNLFRDAPGAFACDASARAIASATIEAGWDLQMSVSERLFVYLPFEHSESVADQTRAVALVQDLGNPQWTRFAQLHQRIIERFGRFPHRNGALGRVSTEAESAFLLEPDSGF